MTAATTHVLRIGASFVTAEDTPPSGCRAAND
jgi:hypothetical protein